MILYNKQSLVFDCSQHGFFHIQNLESGESLSSECLDENLLLFFIAGEVNITYNEFIGHTLKSNHIIHITKSGSFMSEAVKPTQVVIFAYSVPLTICDRSSIQDLRQFIKDKPQQLPVMLVSELISLFLQDIIRYDKADGFSRFPQLHEIKEKELFILFRTQTNKKLLASLFYEVISDSFIFKNKVLEHYAQAKTIKDLSALCGYSTKTFSRLFNEYFSITPYKWLQQQKTKLIPAYIVHNPDKTLIDISERFGFSSLSHFNTFCRKFYGLSAKSLRNKIITEKMNLL